VIFKAQKKERCSEELDAEKQEAEDADACQLKLLEKGRPKIIIFDEHALPKQCYGLSKCTPKSEAQVIQQPDVQMCKVKYPPSEDPDLFEMQDALKWLYFEFASIPELRKKVLHLSDEVDSLSEPLEGSLPQRREEKVNNLQVKVADVGRESLKASVDSIRNMDGFVNLIAEGDELVKQISGELTAHLQQQISSWKAAVAVAAKEMLVSVDSIRNVGDVGSGLNEAMENMTPKAEGEQQWDDSQAQVICRRLLETIKSFAESAGITTGVEEKSIAVLAKLVLQEFVKRLDGESLARQEAQVELTKLQQVEDMSEADWLQLWLKILEWRVKLTKPHEVTKDKVARDKTAAAQGNLSNIEKLQDGPGTERAKEMQTFDESSAVQMRTMVLLPTALFWLSTQ